MTTPPAPPASPNAPPAGTRRDGEATRQRLLRAALELYTTSGLRATTTPEIASRASVAEGTIYRHFNSKEHLLNEVYRGSQRWALTLLKDIEETERSAKAPDRLGRFARRLFEAAERDPAAVRMLLLVREDKALDDKSRDAAREFREALQHLVATGKSDGLVRPGPADLWASVWLNLIAYAAEKVASKEWAPDHPHLGLVVEAAWAAVAGRGAAEMLPNPA